MIDPGVLLTSSATRQSALSSGQVDRTLAKNVGLANLAGTALSLEQGEAKGNIYTGICIDLSSGLGFCAEVAAIAEMLKQRETQIAQVVAVSGNRILPP